MTLIEVLKTSRPYDEEGEETIVSRHAVDEAIATIAQLRDENARLTQYKDGAYTALQKKNDELDALQSTIAQQAADFQALERAHDATCEQLAAAEKAMNRCYKMLLSEPDTKGALFKAENILREALADAAIDAASREGKS